MLRSLVPVMTLATTITALTAMPALIAVHAQGQAPRPAAKHPSTTKPGGIVNLNTASEAELEALPGIGPKAAARIIEYREHKPFKKIEDLMNVQGIGEKSFLKLKPQITVGANAGHSSQQ